jgi:hypothetical protein
MRMRQSMVARHTGGSAPPRGMGCGATGAEGAVSAQNQPMAKCCRENYRRSERYKAAKTVVAEIVGEISKF